MPFLINWDNGNDCGTFPYAFATEAEAEAYGKDWADECNLRDFGTTEPAEDCYTYEVIEKLEPEEPEETEGEAWERMQRECRP